jgi:DNA-binding CsgD family transcriptional regulator
MFSEDEDRNARVREAFSHLTETQQRRLLMLASGLSEREIARREDKDIKTICESIAAARKKFLKFF